MSHYHRAPYGNLWPFPDGRLLLSPSLAKTALTQSRDLAPILLQLLHTVDGGEAVEQGKPEQLLAEMLVRQGYLRSGRHEPDLPPPYELEERHGATWILWSAFDFPLFRQVESELEERGRLVHALLGDGDGTAWTFPRVPGEHPCIECLLRRWLAHKPLEVAGLARDGRQVRWKPAAEAGRLLDQRLDWGCVRIFGESTSVPILPTPQCATCAPLRTSLRPKARNHALRAAHFGLLETQPRTVEPFHLCKATVPGQLWLTGSQPLPYDRGAGSSSSAARDRAVKKALERYHRAPGEGRRRALAAADREAVPILFKPEQNLPELCEGTETDWLPVRRWPGGEEEWLPRALVLPDAQSWTRVADGLEAAEHPHAAIENGLLELIERDAAALFWGRLHRGAAAAGFHMALPEAFEKPLAELGLEATVLQLPSLGAAAVLVILGDGQGRLAFGCACRLVAPQALERALTEALDKYDALLQGPPPAQDVVPTNGAEHRQYYWNFPQRFPWEAVRRLPPLPQQRPKFRDMASLQRELGKQHLLFTCDLTPPDVHQLGFHAVRVIAPQWLYTPAHHRAWPLALERWKRLIGQDMPPAPHPFG